MYSSSGRLIVPLLVYLSLLLASVEAYDNLQQRHANINMKRVMKKRAPLPQATDGPLVGAAPLPVVSKESTAAPAAKTETTTSTTSTSSETSTTRAGKSVVSTVSTSATSSASVSQKSASSVSSAKPSTSASSSLSTTDDAVGVSTIIVPAVTRTASVAASQSVTPDKQGNAASSQVKSTTLTVLIAIAASIGGVFIIWTIFRKWKLSSSQKFDRRLNPIDWQPTTGEDDHIPGHNRRRPSVGSLHSSGHGHGGATDLSRVPSSNHSHSNPFDDFDGPVHSSAPVGGYADLARGTSPTQMQERQHHGVSPVPLHHQGGYGGGY